MTQEVLSEINEKLGRHEETQKDKDGVFEREERYAYLPAPLGDIRQETRYSLREKPRKNTKFYNTSVAQGLAIPNITDESGIPVVVVGS